MSIPEPFYHIFNNFVRDILDTFPEYKCSSQKWWIIGTEDKIKIQNAHAFCVEQYGKYKQMILEKNTADTSFLLLPEIPFNDIWRTDISDNTREAIWKHLQVILLCVIPNIGTKEPDTKEPDTKEPDTKEPDTKEKEDVNMHNIETLLGMFNDETIDETIDTIKQTCKNMENDKSGAGIPGIPGIPDIGNLGIDFNLLRGYVEEVMQGRLGAIATEFAEEAMADLNLSTEDFTNAASIEAIIKKLKNEPSKLMEMAKKIGAKLDAKMKSGDITEAEIKKDATQFFDKIKSMPGIDKLQKMVMSSDLFAKFFGGAKGDAPPSKSKIEHTLKMERMRTRLRARYDAKQLRKEEQLKQTAPEKPALMTEDELISLFNTADTAAPRPTQQKKKKK